MLGNPVEYTKLYKIIEMLIIKWQKKKKNRDNLKSKNETKIPSGVEDGKNFGKLSFFWLQNKRMAECTKCKSSIRAKSGIRGESGMEYW